MDVQTDRRRTAASSDVGPIRLLVVDDDANYRAYLGALTRRLGFAVTTAPDGEAALALLAAGGYDVIVVDHEMPRLTGIDVVRSLRADDATKAIYALMLTAHGEMPTKLAALDAGFDDFVTKSSAEAELVAKLIAARRIAARQRTMDVTIRELYGLATRDELTGLFNRRFFAAETERLLAQGTAVNVILFDLDDFKQVNDTHGHLAGDRVLRDIGTLFHRNTRPEDVVARFGGDEFVMAIPQLDVATIERIAVRLAHDVQALRWSADGATFNIGASTGIASSRLLAQPALAPLLDAADRDMYKNKWLRKHADPTRRPPEATARRRDHRMRRGDDAATSGRSESRVPRTTGRQVGAENGHASS